MRYNYSDDYIQTLKEYKDEIKREVLRSNEIIKSGIENRKSSKVIIGAPTILPSEIKCKPEEHTLKICIYNINGNSNELKLTPSDIRVSEGTLEDISLDEENTKRIMEVINSLNNETLQKIACLNIPIYIININNILSNGNRNEVSVK